MNKSKKFRPSFWGMVVAAVCVMTMQSCFPESDVKTVLRGTLYADSTLTTPLAGDTLVVLDEHLGKVGISLTDDSGHFAFSYWSNGIDAKPEAKFKYEFPPVFLSHHGDTLWGGTSRSYHDNIVIYPGISWTSRWYYEK